MDSSEAKKILALYRPGDTESLDPRMAQALKLAREDTELAAWFGQHCAATLNLPQPEKDETAATGEKPNANDSDGDSILLLNRPVRVLLAIAALTLIAAFVWAHLNNAPANFYGSYRDRMARLVQRSYPMAISATDLAQVRDYFRANKGTINFIAPKNLEKLPPIGAAVFTWHSEPVSLVGWDGGANTNLYLFLIKKTAFTEGPPFEQPQFLRVGKLMTVTWESTDTIYLLTGPMDEPTLKGYLE